MKKATIPLSWHCECVCGHISKHPKRVLLITIAAARVNKGEILAFVPQSCFSTSEIVFN